jgi:hypothetical protein
MATATGADQGFIQVGDIINVPVVVTAVSGGTQPTITGTTKYKGFDGNTDSITVDAIQAVKDE